LSGEPVLERDGPWLRGGVRERLTLGDHDLVVLDVQEIHAGVCGSALVYHDGAYHVVGGS